MGLAEGPKVSSLYNPKCMTKRSEEPLELQVMVSAENPIKPLLILLRSLSVSYSSVLKYLFTSGSLTQAFIMHAMIEAKFHLRSTVVYFRAQACSLSWE